MIRAMRRRSVFGGTVVVAVASTILAVLALGPAGATPPAGYTPTLLAKGSTARALTEQVGGMKFQADGPVDIYSVHATFDPGGTSGWHSHPGPSLVIVKSGTATFYHGDPGCPKEVVLAGTGFVDGGHDLHVVRNEGNVDLVTVVVSLMPAGFARRIDEPAPANCPDLQNG